jgi:hypothetical protein
VELKIKKLKNKKCFVWFSLLFIFCSGDYLNK